MKKVLFAVLSVFLCVNAFAQEQDQKTPTPEEMAAKEADRLGDLLKLEDWQIFRVDSTLQNDFAALQAEMEKMQKSRVDNYDLYMFIRDKWMDQIDNTYRKIFTDSQWAAYLKSGAGKQQKARENRAGDSGTAEEKVILFHGIYLTLHIVLSREVRNCHPESGRCIYGALDYERGNRADSCRDQGTQVQDRERYRGCESASSRKER